LAESDVLLDSDLNQVRPDPETQRIVGAIQQTRDINEPTESNSPKGIVSFVQARPLRIKT
jgi:hypothetical protein